MKEIKGYTNIQNKILRDKVLKPFDKMVLSTIKSLPKDTFNFNAGGIATMLGVNRQTVNKSLKRLEDMGKLARTQIRKTDGSLGRMVYEIIENSPADKLQTKKSSTVIPLPIKAPQSNNKTNNTKPFITNPIYQSSEILPPDEVDYSEVAKQIKTNISFDDLASEESLSGKAQLNEILNIIVDTILASKPKGRL